MRSELLQVLWYLGKITVFCLKDLRSISVCIQLEDCALRCVMVVFKDILNPAINKHSYTTHCGRCSFTPVYWGWGEAVTGTESLPHPGLQAREWPRAFRLVVVLI